MKQKCKCGNIAVWEYAPVSDMENPFFCEDCVPRGCSCNVSNISWSGYPEGIEDIDWKYVTADGIENQNYVYLDEKQREFPCCEFEYDEAGFDIIENEDHE